MRLAILLLLFTAVHVNGDCRLVGSTGTAIFAVASDYSCKTVGTWWLTQGTFFDYVNVKVTCKAGINDPTGRYAGWVLGKFSRAQNIPTTGTTALAANTYYVNANAAVLCGSDICYSGNTNSAACIMNAAGLKLLQTEEQCCLKTYQNKYRDAYGNLKTDLPTIGWGHSTAAPCTTAINYACVYPKCSPYLTTITSTQANTILNEDLKLFAKTMRSKINVPTTPNQFSAILDYAFNFGTGGFPNLLAKLNDWNYAGAALEFTGGNTARRSREQTLFRGSTPVYKSSTIPLCANPGTTSCVGTPC